MIDGAIRLRIRLDLDLTMALEPADLAGPASALLAKYRRAGNERIEEILKDQVGVKWSRAELLSAGVEWTET